MKRFSCIISLYIFLLGGCASSEMCVSENQALEPVSPGKARVIFMRSSFFGSGIHASIFDVTTGEPELIGIISNGTKIAHEAYPGKKTYMVVSEAAEFMSAYLEADKTYYGVVMQGMGVWKDRLSLHPIKNDPDSKFNTTSDEFLKWQKKTRLVENTEMSRQWARDNILDIREKYFEYYAKWKDKTRKEKEQLTLQPYDGM